MEFFRGVLYLFAVLTILKLLSSIYRYFIRSGINIKQYGTWAIITGATDGIGKAYALELAKKGFNLLLISRSESRLRDTEIEIKTKYSSAIQLLSIPIDFSDFDEIAQEKVKRAIANMDIGILINNVGMSYDFPNFFHELDAKTVRNLIEVNVTSTTFMTHAVLPNMLSRSKGVILNISSGAGCTTSPLLAEYSAAKGYIDRLSNALYYEYKNKGIHIQVQNPLYVTTKLAKIRHSSLLFPTPSQYVRASLRFIGYESQCSPYWIHALQLWLGSWSESLLIKYVYAEHDKIRKRALKKKQENNAAKRD